MVSADEVLRALAAYCHERNCFFTTNCRSGPSDGPEKYFEFDALSVARSWRRFCIAVYEVKIARQDFLRDTKWPEYRAYCHQLYFVCPEKLITKEELPSDVGLIYYKPQTGTVRVTRMAAHRQINVSWELLAHIIMSHLRSDRHPFFTDARLFWERWVEQRKMDYDLARRVRGKIRDALYDAARKVENLQETQRRLERDAQAFGLIQKILLEYGIRVWLGYDGYLWGEKELRDRLAAGVNPEVRTLVEKMARDVERLRLMIGDGGNGGSSIPLG